jgi:Ca-activated chloride channel family protein
MRRYAAVFVVLGCLCAIIPPDRGYAASPRSLVSKGNSVYLAGKYDEALSAYNEASVQMPESPRIYFNKGAALYRKGDYNKATEMFEKAALKARDIRLETRAKFNLGNCSFREAERQRDSDINKALEACEKSILFYQEALELDRGFKRAAENIEIVRLTMKTILDEIQKQKESAKKRQQAGDKLKKLIQRQAALLDRNGSLSEGNQDGEHHKEKVKALADDQDALRKETQDLAKDMHPSTQKTPSPSPPEPAGKHLENASNAQGLASEKIRQDRLKPALADQKGAIDEMKEALKSLNGNNGKGAGQDQQKQQNAGEKDRKKGQQQEVGSANQKKVDKMNPEEGRSVMARPPDDAQSILDQEKENMKHRRLPYAGGYREVDKDW